MNRLQSGKMSTPTPVSKAEVKEEVCIVCSQKKQTGLYIWGHFICRQCEKEMVEMSASGQERPQL